MKRPSYSRFQSHKVLLLLSILAAMLWSAQPAPSQIQTAKVTGGEVRGVIKDGIASFKGIPFAAPPVGELRWRAPQPVKPWEGVRVADAFAPGPMQPAMVAVVMGAPANLSEDCLYLNLWMPAAPAQPRLPVMVWIYGGGFAAGATSEPRQDAGNLSKKGVLVVTMNYRLGVFGFFSHPALARESGRNAAGNYGLLDQVAALKWVKDNEPKIYAKIYKMMLPGDYIAMKMTGEIKTTPSGLSEGIMWDFKEEGLSQFVCEEYGISQNLVAEAVPTFSVQGHLTKESANLLGLKAGTIVSYRAGDQPNNALSLNVLNPGEIAATAGTSGVVYGIAAKAKYDAKSRVNTFVHVNHAADKPRYGVLLCVNGTGILNSWLKHNTGAIDYPEMNALAEKASVGSEGLVILPYGNGAKTEILVL